MAKRWALSVTAQESKSNTSNDSVQINTTEEAASTHVQGSRQYCRRFLSPRVCISTFNLFFHLPFGKYVAWRGWPLYSDAASVDFMEIQIDWHSCKVRLRMCSVCSMSSMLHTPHSEARAGNGRRMKRRALKHDEDNYYFCLQQKTPMLATANVILQHRSGNATTLAENHRGLVLCHRPFWVHAVVVAHLPNLRARHHCIFF